MKKLKELLNKLLSFILCGSSELPQQSSFKVISATLQQSWAYMMPQHFCKNTDGSKMDLIEQRNLFKQFVDFLSRISKEEQKSLSDLFKLGGSNG